MITTVLGVFIRILSNSYLNVFQKILTSRGEKSSVINFYTYLGLSILGLFFLPHLVFSKVLIINVLIMGLLGALGNFFIIKALSIGELSALAPINSYKPVVALLTGIFYLHEIPSSSAVFAIALIILGTYFVLNVKGNLNTKAVLYRVFALVFSGAEAVFIKKIVIMTGVSKAFFLWAFSGLIFSFLFVIFARNSFKIPEIKHQLLLILAVGVMQYSTNYVFSKMNVSYALALFQLSTILSVFLGANIFHETNIKRKLAGASIMLAGAVILILG